MKIKIKPRELLKDYAITYYTTYPIPSDSGGCDEAIEKVELPEEIEIDIAIDIQAALVENNQIAAIWSIEDVQHVRPDLSDDQAWEVLRAIEHDHDCNHGITWYHLRMEAEHLFPEGEAA